MRNDPRTKPKTLLRRFTLRRYGALLRCVAMLLVMLAAGASAMARDLPAAGAGEHLWFIQQQPAPESDQDAGPEMSVYHLHNEALTGQAVELDPIKGELMPRGVAAGDGQLLIVTKDRQVKTLRPAWSELMRRWEYQSRMLPQLPEGCTLLSIVMSGRGPWALVHVQSDELLRELDRIDAPQQLGPTDEQILNQALGLPQNLQWDETPGNEPAESDQTDEDTPGDAPDRESPASEQAPEDAPEHAPEQATDEDTDEAREKAPALRLIHLRSGAWVSSPLPEGFDVPRDVVMLIRPDDKRPTLIVDNDTAAGPSLVRYNPIASTPPPSETEPDTDTGAADDAASTQTTSAPVWSKVTTGLHPWPGRLWSATLVNGQVVAAIERYRPRNTVTVDTYLLRGQDAIEVGWISLPAADATRWAVLPWRGTIGMIASPVPTQDPAQQVVTTTPIIASLAGLSLAGEPLYHDDAGAPRLIYVTEFMPNALDGNADLLIQIIAFVFAMFAMVMFYRRAPTPDQIDLPDHLVLASFGRRAIAGIIDLTPGFLLASMIYDISFNDIVLYAWPGNGVEKAFAAMRPGLVVIAVTLFHTTIMEFIFARSPGKFVTGLYVAELSGRPAPPAPCLGRAISRAFELFAPLMILIAVISPARQRLGDILAKTIVVMDKPREPEEQDNDDDDF